MHSCRERDTAANAARGGRELAQRPDGITAAAAASGHRAPDGNTQSIGGPRCQRVATESPVLRGCAIPGRRLACKKSFLFAGFL